MSVHAPIAPERLVVRQVDDQSQHRLILYNDEVNTFEWVIESLIKICNHSHEQAEQCAYIVHYKGKYAVLGGSYDYLTPRCRALDQRGLTVSIE